MYDDSYGYYGDDAAMPACIAGTDCTDCGGPLASNAFTDPESLDSMAGDWDDDEWFDDDTEEWWDDDYDFGEEWDGFEDDEKDGYGPIGIISSVEPMKKPNKRHSRGAAGSSSTSFLNPGEHPAALLAFLSVAGIGALCFCIKLGKDKVTPDAEPCCGGKRKHSQA